MSQSNIPPQSIVIASLFIQAVRQGQSLWFRVASNSMYPLLRRDDTVFIQPASAKDIRVGDIAAFESANSLIIHRIVHTQQTADSLRLLQMSDVELLPSWVNEEVVVGKVVMVRRKQRQTALQHPIAQWGGKVTARVRHRLYLYDKNSPIRLALRACSRLTLIFGYWCIRCFCTSAVPHN